MDKHKHGKKRKKRKSPVPCWGLKVYPNNEDSNHVIIIDKTRT